MTDNNWTVQLISQAKKFNLNLPKDAQLQLLALIRSLSKIGPIQYEWPHYSKLNGKKECYHCHIERGRPTYVACWQVVDKKQKNNRGILCRDTRESTILILIRIERD